LRSQCPKELVDRATDLVYGLPNPPQRAYEHQLEAAEDLVKRLEIHALRRTAETANRQVEHLTRNKHRHPKPEEVETLLTQIQSLGHDKPLPFTLRQKLIAAEAATRSRHGRN
jgi:hypothetical protein